MTALRQQIRVQIDSTLGPDARRLEFARIARAGVADLIASGRAPARYVRYVDGNRDAPEESVSAIGGVILYQFAAVGEAAAFALAFLRARSPVASGRYRDSFIVAVDGRQIAAASFNPDSVPPSAEIIITNTQPYSRKVDVQLVGNRKLNFSVPPGLFDDAVRAVRGRFGNTVKASRSYTIDFPGRYVLVRHKKHGRRSGQKVDSPALILSPVG